MQDPTERGVSLTEAEAMGLLELLMTYPGELDDDQRAGLIKLSDYCRKCLRESDDAAASGNDGASCEFLTTVAA